MLATNVYFGRSNPLRKSLANLVKTNFDSSLIDGLTVHPSNNDYILLNPTRGAEYPYVFLFLKSFEPYTNDKDAVIMRYDFMVEVYDQFQEYTGSRPSVIYALIENVLEIIKNKYHTINSSDFRILAIKLGRTSFDKQIDAGQTMWTCYSEFNLDVGFS